MKRIKLIALLGAFTIGIIGGTPLVVHAAEEAPQPRTSEMEPTSDRREVEPTFALEKETDEEGIFRFGHNLLVAGNNLNITEVGRSLLLAFGNSLQIGSDSEYAFVFGNDIDFTGETEKDAFIAGNTISLKPGAKIGRDVFAAGYSLVGEVNLPGNLAVTANQVTLRNMTIRGNVDLSAQYIVFEGKVMIDGALTYNEDAQVSGLSNVKAAKTETYEIKDNSLTAGEYWFGKFASMVALFIVMLVCLLIFPSLVQHIDRESTMPRLGFNFCVGLAVVFFAPIVAIMLLLTPFTVPAGLLILGLYIIMLYLAQGFAAVWLGHALVAKLCRSRLPILLETLLGILILGCLSMIPSVSALAVLLAAICGVGLMIVCIQSGRKNHDMATEHGKGGSASDSKTAKRSLSLTAKTATKKSTPKPKNSGQ